MKYLNLLWALLCIPAFGFQGGIEGGNGGGGVVKDGRYMTFYSAGLYVEPMNAVDAPLRLPAIQRLAETLASYPSLGAETKRAYLAAAQPTTTRRYLIAVPELLTPEVKARILAEFQRVTGVDPAKLELYALTDTQQKVTYILPGFEKLSANDQMAILFHEAYWLVNPNAKYDDVVHAEMAFEASTTHAGDLAAAYDFVNAVGTPAEAYAALVKWDLASGSLQGFVDTKNQFSLGALIGDAYLRCVADQGGRQLTDNPYPYRAEFIDYHDDSLAPLLVASDTCAPYFRMHLNDLLAAYPKSMLLRTLAGTFDAGNPLLGFRNRYVVTSETPEARTVHFDRCLPGTSTKILRAGALSRDESHTTRFDWDVKSLASCVATFGSRSNPVVTCAAASMVVHAEDDFSHHVRISQCTGKFQFQLNVAP